MGCWWGGTQAMSGTRGTQPGGYCKGPARRQLLRHEVMMKGASPEITGVGDGVGGGSQGTAPLGHM